MSSLSVIGYYDSFRERLVADYEYGNPRVTAALEFARDALADARSVLDVGCGIGWSSAELAREGKLVLGLDISPILIETAREMFGESSRFEVADFAEYESEERFDAVLMVDVYEHFPLDVRPCIYERLIQTRAQKIVLTVPTPQAQQFARDHEIPLQPIDEDVTEEDIEELATRVRGGVVISRLVSVWRPDDYRHVLIEVSA